MGNFKISESDDYIVMQTEKYEFYYGYEYGQEMANRHGIADIPRDAWGFIITSLPDKKLRCFRTDSDDDTLSSGDMSEALIAQFAMMINEGVIGILA